MAEELGTQRLLLAVLTGLCGLTFVLVGCGSSTTNASLSSLAPSGASCPRVQSASFDKTKFVLHAGLGFGAFHHFIYEPFRSGDFTSGSRSQARHLAEAGLAAAFTAHELRLAKRDAEDNPTLCRVVAAPLNAAAASLQLLDNRLSSGQASGNDINKVNTMIDQAQRGSAQAGIPVADQIPSTQQLAHPS